MANFTESTPAENITNQSNATTAADCGPEEVFNQTAQACQAAAQNAGGMLDGISGIIFVGFALLILILIIVGLLLKRNQGDDYVQTKMEERIDNKLVEPTMEKGKKVNKTAYYGDEQDKKKLGKVRRRKNMTTRLNLVKHDEKEEESGESEEPYPVTNFEIIPDSFWGRLKAAAGPTNPRKNDQKEFYSLPQEVDISWINDKEPGTETRKVYLDKGDHILIRRIDTEKTYGIWRASGRKGFFHITERSQSSVNEDLAQLNANQPEWMQHYNMKNMEHKDFLKEKFKILGDYNDRKEGKEKEQASE